MESAMKSIRTCQNMDGLIGREIIHVHIGNAAD